jgi:uncharacterized repeat protein (TIGR03803 family)
MLFFIDRMPVPDYYSRLQTAQLFPLCGEGSILGLTRDLGFFLDPTVEPPDLQEAMTRKTGVALRFSLPNRDVAPRSGAQWKLLTIILAVFLACTATLTDAQTFTTILTFDGSDGAAAISGLVQGTDGSFYGTSVYGGPTGWPSNGTVFKVSPNGAITTLPQFCLASRCVDGQYPRASLLLGNDGNLYGTTAQGGATDFGSVFRINSKGTLVTVYSFCPQKGCSDGSFPSSPLVQGKDGQFYGSTYEGGANNHGTLFRVSPNGELTQLYRFCSETGCADGNRPSGAGMVQSTDGNFYGVTGLGGSHGPYGTVFKLTPSGKFTSLYSFCSQANCADGIQPSGLLRATDGNFYGTTAAGGACPYSAQGCGTIFKITTAGELTVLYTFCLQSNCYDGAFPAGLVQATDGNIYGVTSQGGQVGAGSIFKITLAGKLSTLYSFCSQPFCPDGGEPSSLVQGTGGSFWGVTQVNFGGDHAPLCGIYCGTVFKFGASLGPFVQALPNARKVGGLVRILGNSLNGTTSVSFNGTAAAFTVVSASEITATVPAGATTGKVKVVTPHGTLISNAVFSVTP